MKSFKIYRHCKSFRKYSGWYVLPCTFDLFVYPHLKQHSCTNSSSTHDTTECQCRRQRSPRQKITLRDLSDLLWKALLDDWLARFSSHCTTHCLPVHIIQQIFRVLTSHLETVHVKPLMIINKKGRRAYHHCKNRIWPFKISYNEW